ncbi:MAG: glycosyltransferase family 39 protein [Thermoanaerobaculia bacterium]|nr:glycosyltransferase family 39 protein [Thermoanaerobaculia bacterium]
MPRERLLLILVALVAISALITPLQRELYVGDETKYSQIIREMRAGGSFLFPPLHGKPFTHKPPVHFWMIDALTYPLGTYSIWPYVIPSILAFVAMLWLMWRMGGPLAAFICGTALMIWGSAQTARMDVSFTALLVFAAWRLWLFFDEGQPRDLMLCGIATGIATLVKGPMAPVIIVALFIFERIRRRSAPRANYVPAIAAMIIIPLLWFVPAMMAGGDEYTREVVVKQTAGRAVGAWVHKAAPWFYVTHAPGDLFPWFFLAVVALIAAYKRRDERAKFCVSWILAVLVPYSLLSSKLDIYMMAMIPPVALIVARFAGHGADDTWSRWGWRANILTLGILAGIGAAGLIVSPAQIKGPEAALASDPRVRMLFWILAGAGVIALVIAIRSRRLLTSTLLVGAVPLVAFVYAAIALIPIANELASTRRFIAAIEKQRVAPELVGVYFMPHIWARGMDPALERVKTIEVSSAELHEVIVTSRRRSSDIAAHLGGYRKVDEFRMIGKWFDVYRR